LVNAIR